MSLPRERPSVAISFLAAVLTATLSCPLSTVVIFWGLAVTELLNGFTAYVGLISAATLGLCVIPAWAALATHTSQGRAIEERREREAQLGHTELGRELIFEARELGVHLSRDLAERLGREVPDAVERTLRLTAAAARYQARASTRRQADLEALLGLDGATRGPTLPSMGEPRAVSAGRQVVPISAGQYCPFCREPLEATAGGVTSCAACRTVLHKECLAELGGCPTQGCRNNPRDRQRT